jgi:hypothetical protein
MPSMVQTSCITICNKDAFLMTNACLDNQRRISLLLHYWATCDFSSSQVLFSSHAHHDCCLFLPDRWVHSSHQSHISPWQEKTLSRKSHNERYGIAGELPECSLQCSPRSWSHQNFSVGVSDEGARKKTVRLAVPPPSPEFVGYDSKVMSLLSCVGWSEQEVSEYQRANIRYISVQDFGVTNL